VDRPKWTSSKIRKQEVHSNGPVLDDTLLADPEVGLHFIPIEQSMCHHFAVRQNSNLSIDHLLMSAKNLNTMKCQLQVHILPSLLPWLSKSFS
jgi:hypothetical protein